MHAQIHVYIDTYIYIRKYIHRGAQARERKNTRKVSERKPR